MKLNGFYKGSVGNSKSNWLGKTFFASKFSGINNFKEDGKVVARYPFKTYMRNKILKLDYNIKENPWWLKLIVDDLIEVKPNKFKGVMKIKILPGILIPVAKFKLEKE